MELKKCIYQDEVRIFCSLKPAPSVRANQKIHPLSARFIRSPSRKWTEHLQTSSQWRAGSKILDIMQYLMEAGKNNFLQELYIQYNHWIPFPCFRKKCLLISKKDSKLPETSSLLLKIGHPKGKACISTIHCQGTNLLLLSGRVPTNLPGFLFHPQKSPPVQLT